MLSALHNRMSMQRAWIIGFQSLLNNETLNGIRFICG